MPTLSSERTIPFPGANAWVRAAAQCHFNVNPILLTAGLAVDQHGAHHIRRDGLIEVMMQCVYQAAPMHHFPLLVGEAFVFDNLPAIETFLSASPTLRDAMPVLAWTSQMLTDVDIRLLSEGAQSAIVIDVQRQPGDAPKAAGYFVEVIVACMAKFGRLVLGGKTLASRIDFMHDPGPVRTVCEMQFNAPIRVNQPRNALVFDTTLLDHSLPGALPSLHRQLRDFIAQQFPEGGAMSMRAQLENLFRRDPRLMGQGLKKVADLMNIHPRTLQRRLKDEGCVYGDIQTHCRYEHAVIRLKVGQVDIDGLSEELGFTDRNSFTRAFKEWTGVAPRDYRKRHRASSSQNELDRAALPYVSQA